MLYVLKPAPCTGLLGSLKSTVADLTYDASRCTRCLQNTTNKDAWPPGMHAGQYINININIKWALVQAEASRRLRRRPSRGARCWRMT